MKKFILLCAFSLMTVTESFAVTNEINVRGNAWDGVNLVPAVGICLYSNDVVIDGYNNITIYMRTGVGTIAGQVNMEISPDGVDYFGMNSINLSNSQSGNGSLNGVTSYISIINDLSAKRIRFRFCGVNGNENYQNVTITVNANNKYK